MAIRLGGIYALERIAKDHRQVMEVLTPTYRKTPAGKGNAMRMECQFLMNRRSTGFQRIFRPF